MASGAAAVLSAILAVFSTDSSESAKSGQRMYSETYVKPDIWNPFDNWPKDHHRHLRPQEPLDQ
jgi:hypothetical protein